MHSFEIEDKSYIKIIFIVQFIFTSVMLCLQFELLIMTLIALCNKFAPNA